MYLLVLLCPLVAVSQSYKLRGNVRSANGDKLADAYIIVKKGTSSPTLLQTRSDKDGNFAGDLYLHTGDSVYVTCSYVGFATYQYKNTVEGDVRVDAVLLEIPKNLEEVSVKTPPIRQSGDTTFYDVKAFKDGSERKLKDVLEKMPGFEYEKGKLTYRGMTVSKILIDGEDIFGDKANMLLHNIPVHILSQIQAITNQTDNPLLKGLASSGDVVINLSLNKEKLKMAFGEGEGGIGSDARYRFNPVAFSLYSKYKLGYIGNWSKIGGGISWKEDDELKNSTGKLLAGKMPTLPQPLYISDLDNSWYIKNKLFDNRFQLTAPISKRLKTISKIEWVTDQQTQVNTTQSQLQSINGYTFRNQSTDSRYCPAYLNLKERVEWKIDTSKQLVLSVENYRNTSQASQYKINTQDNITDTSSQYLRNNWNTMLGSILFTWRLDKLRAIQVNAVSSHSRYAQYGTSMSDAWQTLFGIPDNRHNNMYLQPFGRYTLNGIKMNYMQKKKGLSLKPEITIKSERLALQTPFYFSRVYRGINGILRIPLFVLWAAMEGNRVYLY